MLNKPVIVLVGGPKTGKTQFFVECTSSVNTPMWITNDFVMIDTPGIINYRNPYEYSWQGLFQYADVILDFGNWLESEIYGFKNVSPRYMTWSGDNRETLKRVQEYLQGR